jgi:hypothetical protein
MVPGQFRKEQAASHESAPERGIQSAATQVGQGTYQRTEVRAPSQFMPTEQFKKEQATSHEPSRTAGLRPGTVAGLETGVTQEGFLLEAPT